MTPALGAAVSETCGQYLFSPGDVLDWGQPTAASGYSAFGQASNGASAGPWFATSAFGTGVTLNSGPMLMQRLDNTHFAWSAFLGSWVDPSTAELFQSDHAASLPINTFDGRFGAPSSPTPVPQYGDSLIRLLQPLTSPGSSSALAMSFSLPVAGVGFRVSSGSNANFIATLQAFDALGNLIGTYEVDATGLGGICAGLQTLSGSGNPVPCNDAPLIQFADPLGRIKSVNLAVNDSTALVDGLQLQTDSVPESATGLMLGIGVLGLAGLRKQRAS